MSKVCTTLVKKYAIEYTSGLNNIFFLYKSMQGGWEYILYTDMQIIYWHFKCIPIKKYV